MKRSAFGAIFDCAPLILVLVLVLSNEASAATVAGRTVGNYAVSPTGAATYSIPIWAPPGVRGIEPHLSLVYNSQVGDGILGPGWSLSGLRSISRCAGTWAQDSAASPVSLSSADKFCLDGKRLRGTSGTYGSDLSTYQTEIADFSNVTAHGAAGNGPQYFIVQDRNGLTYEFGNSTDSRVLVAPSIPTPYLWLLNSVHDPQGNTMSITYSLANGTGVPSAITYTSNAQAGLTAAYEMSFSYVNKPANGNIAKYIAGSLTQQQLNLGTITVYSLLPSQTSVRQYSMGYSASPTTPRNLLTSITECAGPTSSDCFSPTLMQYQPGQAGAPSTLTSTGLSPTFSWFSVDVDGDGRDDIVYEGGTFNSVTWYVAFATGNGFSAPQPILSGPTSILLDDFLGSGHTDVLAVVGGYWTLYHWNGSSFSVTTTTTAPQSGSFSPVSADINGDGLPDLVWANNDGWIYTELNTTSPGGPLSFSPTMTQALFKSTGGIAGSILIGNNSSPKIKHLDFNGDGRQDVLWVQGLSGAGELISQGSTFSLGPVVPGTGSHCRSTGTMTAAPISFPRASYWFQHAMERAVPSPSQCRRDTPARSPWTGMEMAGPTCSSRIRMVTTKRSFRQALPT